MSFILPSNDSVTVMALGLFLPLSLLLMALLLPVTQCYVLEICEKQKQS